jgi:hypothetical protein
LDPVFSIFSGFFLGKESSPWSFSNLPFRRAAEALSGWSTCTTGKLLGNVPEGVYERKMREYQEEEMRVSAALEFFEQLEESSFSTSSSDFCTLSTENFRTRAKGSFYLP